MTSVTYDLEGVQKIGSPGMDPKHFQGPYTKGPSTKYLRFLVPKTILLMVFGTRVLKYWVLGPSGLIRGTPFRARPT